MFKPRGVGCCKCKEPIYLATEIDEIHYLAHGMCPTCLELEQYQDSKEMFRNKKNDAIGLMEFNLESKEEILTVLKEIRDELRVGRINYSYNFYGYGAGSGGTAAPCEYGRRETCDARDVNSGGNSAANKRRESNLREPDSR